MNNINNKKNETTNAGRSHDNESIADVVHIHTTQTLILYRTKKI